MKRLQGGDEIGDVGRGCEALRCSRAAGEASLTQLAFQQLAHTRGLLGDRGVVILASTLHQQLQRRLERMGEVARRIA